MLKRVTKELPCALSEEEKRLRGRELAAEVRKKLDLEDEKKDVNASFKERKDEIDGKIVKLTNVVTSGLEPRQIECEGRYAKRRVLHELGRRPGRLRRERQDAQRAAARHGGGEARGDTSP
jgi:hypothetical protein